jgi:hypothetical protein
LVIQSRDTTTKCLPGRGRGFPSIATEQPKLQALEQHTKSIVVLAHWSLLLLLLLVVVVVVSNCTPGFRTPRSAHLSSLYCRNTTISADIDAILEYQQRVRQAVSRDTDHYWSDVHLGAEAGKCD